MIIVIIIIIKKKIQTLQGQDRVLSQPSISYYNKYNFIFSCDNYIETIILIWFIYYN